MAITFTNHLNTNILSPLEALLKAEFTIPVCYDIDYVQRGTNWFNLVPIADEVVEDLASGHVRQFEINVQYYRIISGKYRRETHIDAVSAIMERVKSLIRNNTSHSTFFFDGQLSNINYQADPGDVSSDVVLVEATFIAKVLEVV